uniref:Uncharacterized protein n=1 Tax=Mus musculus TaxID=10090 RepID=Q3TCR3_MOUSE|nr:unnamed protein product [Mus musculus]
MWLPQLRGALIACEARTGGAGSLSLQRPLLEQHGYGSCSAQHSTFFFLKNSGSSLGAVFAALCWSRIELPRTAYGWILLCLCDFSDSLGNTPNGTPKFASFSRLGLE